MIRDDMEIYQLMQMCGGYKYDTALMNRMML
jgi:hypothetical protein